VRWRPDSPSIYLPNSGQIDLNAIGVEAGQANNSQTALNDAAVRDMIGKGANAQNAMSEYYGASSVQPIDISTMGPSTARMYATWGAGRSRWNPGPSAWKGGPMTDAATALVGFVLANQNLKLVAGVTYRVEFEASNSFIADRWDDYKISIGLYTGDFTTTPMFEPAGPEGTNPNLDHWTADYSQYPLISNETDLWTMRKADSDWPGNGANAARINDNGSMVKPTSHLLSGSANWGQQSGMYTRFKSSFNWTPGSGILGVRLDNGAVQAGSGTVLEIHTLKITPL